MFPFPVRLARVGMMSCSYFDFPGVSVVHKHSKSLRNIRRESQNLEQKEALKSESQWKGFISLSLSGLLFGFVH